MDFGLFEWLLVALKTENVRLSVRLMDARVFLCIPVDTEVVVSTAEEGEIK